MCLRPPTPGARLLAALGSGLLLSASAVGAAEIELSANGGAGIVCQGVTDGTVFCSAEDAPGSQLTVTWSLDSRQSIHGYDLEIRWDPGELDLLEAEQLFPDDQLPGSVPFVVAPDPGDPWGSEAAALSLAASETRDLLRLTFAVVGEIRTDCEADVAWSANGNGLSPGSLVLDNPAGAGLDSAALGECNDGLDNDGDGHTDFDGGACAGLDPAMQADPDPQCTSFADTREGGSCGLGLELALVLGPLAAWRRRLRIGPRGTSGYDDRP